MRCPQPAARYDFGKRIESLGAVFRCLRELVRQLDEKIRAAAESGLFNVFMGEFNFSDLPESELMRSIRLFGEKVIPALRDYEPF